MSQITPHRSDPWLGRWPLRLYRGLRGLVDPVVRDTNRAAAARARFFRELFAAGDLVFDIGANHGLRSRHFLELGARVVAVEPQPHCAAELRAALGRHPRFRLEETALGAAPGTLILRVCENCDVLSTVLRPEELPARFQSGEFQWREHSVPVTTLDALIARHGSPSFCKIDVEGYEEQVLKGLSRPLQAFSLELMTETFETLCRCCRRMESLARYHYRFSEADSLSWAHERWLPLEEFLALLQSRLTPETWGDVYGRISTG